MIKIEVENEMSFCKSRAGFLRICENLNSHLTSSIFEIGRTEVEGSREGFGLLKSARGCKRSNF